MSGPPVWVDGEPANLAAAALDADEWLALIEALNDSGRWRLNISDSRARLASSRAAIKRLTAAQPGEQSPWRDLFWSLADGLKCLPSSFLDGNAHVFRAAAGYRSDAERFRWLAEDHADPETRAKCREILGGMGVSSYSAACADIDAAMAASKAGVAK